MILVGSGLGFCAKMDVHFGWLEMQSENQLLARPKTLPEEEPSETWCPKPIAG